MKLKIGDNIHKFRKQIDRTQAQLAEQLGVSCQSVSRWENGTTYPDMELLPALAKMFGKSVNERLGIPDEKKEAAAMEAFIRLAKLSNEKNIDTAKANRLIRDIRLNHLDSEHFWHFGLSLNHRVYRNAGDSPGGQIDSGGDSRRQRKHVEQK